MHVVKANATQSSDWVVGLLLQLTAASENRRQAHHKGIRSGVDRRVRDRAHVSSCFVSCLVRCGKTGPQRRFSCLMIRRLTDRRALERIIFMRPRDALRFSPVLAWSEFYSSNGAIDFIGSQIRLAWFSMPTERILPSSSRRCQLNAVGSRRAGTGRLPDWLHPRD